MTKTDEKENRDQDLGSPSEQEKVLEEDYILSKESMSEPVQPPDEIKKLQERLEMERAKNEDLVKQMRYLQADIVNLQRQSDRMLVDVRNQSRLSLLLELITLREDLERATNAVESPSNGKESLIEGLKLLEAKMDNLLRAEDVSAISVKIGSKLDPRIHEAVSSRETVEFEEGTILSVIGQGYKINGKVVKPALVEVARKDHKVSEPEEEKLRGDATSSELA